MTSCHSEYQECKGNIEPWVLLISELIELLSNVVYYLASAAITNTTDWGGGLLKQQKCIFSQFWGLGVQNPGVDGAGVCRGLSPWTADFWLLVTSSRGLASMCKHVCVFKASFLKGHQGTYLVVQWLRICLPMQATRVWALVQEDPTCRGAAKPVCHNYWACALEPASHSYWAH